MKHIFLVALIVGLTFIVMKGGKEVGRVIEYGKNGRWDKEIGEIVATKF